jgi:hypothetical protein
MSDDDPGLQFQLNWIDACAQFAEQCAKARDGNPFGSRFAALDEMIAYMATELWDRNFSQSEIGGAFAKASDDLRPYAAGEERRGDRR